ncbi:MAG: hypothetical protein R1F52_00575 [Candidatus Nitrosoabyssus spongiisocia]|nr:MAG: hypothetical protein R1F52_00575 [Nitrosopumilaceae archaeon AB1(1)]
MNDDTIEITVLGAIKRGCKKFNKIKNMTKLPSTDINSALERLEKNHMIRVEEKSGWLGKKIEITTTRRGDDELDVKIQVMEQNWSKMATAYESGNKKDVRQFMDSNRSILPTMLFFGIIDMVMFSMMFSMIGSTMTDYIPTESIPDGYGGDGIDDGGMDDSRFDFDIGF